jgi:outer membrane receptor protein involved in Fe transport
MNHNLKFLMNYSYLHMKEPILSSPEHKLFISSTYTINKFSFNLAIQTIGNLYLVTGNTPLTESYTLFNARMAYKIKDFASIFVKGQNLTNTRYQINYGYPMPGIIGFGGINITL